MEGIEDISQRLGKPASRGTSLKEQINPDIYAT